MLPYLRPLPPWPGVKIDEVRFVQGPDSERVIRYLLEEAILTLQPETYLYTPFPEPDFFVLGGEVSKFVQLIGDAGPKEDISIYAGRNIIATLRCTAGYPGGAMNFEGICHLYARRYPRGLKSYKDRSQDYMNDTHRGGSHWTYAVEMVSPDQQHGKETSLKHESVVRCVLPSTTEISLEGKLVQHVPTWKDIITSLQAVVQTSRIQRRPTITLNLPPGNGDVQQPGVSRSKYSDDRISNQNSVPNQRQGQSPGAGKLIRDSGHQNTGMTSSHQADSSSVNSASKKIPCGETNVTWPLGTTKDSEARQNGSVKQITQEKKIKEARDLIAWQQNEAVMNSIKFQRKADLHFQDTYISPYSVSRSPQQQSLHGCSHNTSPMRSEMATIEVRDMSTVPSSTYGCEKTKRKRSDIDSEQEQKKIRAGDYDHHE